MNHLYTQQEGEQLKISLYLFLLVSLSLHSFLLVHFRRSDLSVQTANASAVTDSSYGLSLELVERKKLPLAADHLTSTMNFVSGGLKSKPLPPKAKTITSIDSGISQKQQGRLLSYTQLQKIETSGKTEITLPATPSSVGSYHSKKKDQYYSEVYYQPPPQYPPEALQQKLEGALRIEIHTNNEGLVTLIHLEQSTGHPSLDAEALRTVKKWRLTSNSVFHIPFHFKIVGKNEKNRIDHSSKE